MLFCGAPVGALLLVMLSSNAYGYINFFSDSYLFQLLIAGLIGGLFALKLYCFRVKAFCMSKFARRRKDQDD